MKFIRLSILVGLLCAIPICAVIYLGVDRLEKNVPKMREFQEMLTDIPTVPIEAEETRSLDGIPTERRLTNHAGRQLDTIVTGRSAEMLHFFAFLHNRNYHYPITKLSEKDQAFAATLPLSVEKAPAYPILRLLADDQGEARLVLIDGRTQFDLFFRVFEESEKRTFPINRLSPQDRNFVFGLPIN